MTTDTKDPYLELVEVQLADAKLGYQRRKMFAHREDLEGDTGQAIIENRRNEILAEDVRTRVHANQIAMERLEIDKMQLQLNAAALEEMRALAVVRSTFAGLAEEALAWLKARFS